MTKTVPAVLSLSTAQKYTNAQTNLYNQKNNIVFVFV